MVSGDHSTQISDSVRIPRSLQNSMLLENNGCFFSFPSTSYTSASHWCTLTNTRLARESGKHNFLVFRPMYWKRAELGGNNTNSHSLNNSLAKCGFLALVGLGDYPTQSTGPGSAYVVKVHLSHKTPWSWELSQFHSEHMDWEWRRLSLEQKFEILSLNEGTYTQETEKHWLFAQIPEWFRQIS